MSRLEDTAQPDRILFLFVDGLGLRSAAPNNPVNEANCPTLCGLIRGHSVPLDACLGVDGVPQSATGQAALFTGVNVARELGRHISGFPGPQLRDVIEHNNLFLALAQRGIPCKFANGYYGLSIKEIAGRRMRSVTTVMALTVPDSISTQDDLLAGFAVSEDLTRHGIRTRGFDGPPIEPEEAAGHLAALSSRNRFTLFEYFQTDRMGHSRDIERAAAVLRSYDRFLARLVDLLLESRTLLLLTSDHGNIEHMPEHTHTRNPVPLVAFGPGEAEFRRGLGCITDVMQRVLQFLVP